MAGRRTSENLFLLNGIEYTGSSQLAITPGGTSGYLLGIDAVREFNVLTDTYSRRIRQASGRAGERGHAVRHATRCTARYSSFCATARSMRGTLSRKAPRSLLTSRTNSARALGGPLKKDRWFLFGNYEGFRQSLAVDNVSDRPGRQARQGILPPNAIAGVFTVRI